MELNLIETLASGGPVAILAFLIFWMYRRDKKASEDRINDIHEAHSKRLDSLLRKDQKSREKNTKAITELTTYIRKVNNGGTR